MKVIFNVTLFLIVLGVSLSEGIAKKRERTSLRVVVQDTEGLPVPRASVVVRTLKGKKLKKVGRSFELRTSQQGTAPLPPLKEGYVLVQVIARGYKTFGERLELRGVDQEYKIVLEAPQEQHSVHERKKK